MAVTGDDEVTREPARRAVRQMEDRIRELKRQLGRKTLEVEILRVRRDRGRSAAAKARRTWRSHGQKNRHCSRSRS